MNEQRIDSLVTFLDELGASIGAELFLVGGFVRDHLIGRDSKDIDVLARGVPEAELIDRLSPFGKVERTGAVFGVIRFFPKDKSLPMLEIALPRKERSTGDGHKDFVVEFDHTLAVEDDLMRRDFTVNAMALTIPELKLVDPYPNGGSCLGDLDSGVLRMVSATSAEDDALRILRGLRFASQLGFVFSEDTEKQMRENVELLSTISAERVQEELVKLVSGKHVGAALRTAQEIGAIAVILPELEEGVGCEQNHYHDFDVFEHIIRVVENTPSENPYVKLGALFHDIAKPAVKWTGPDGIPHFYGADSKQKYIVEPRVRGHHEIIGSDMTIDIMKRLKFSKNNIDFVSMLVREHMFNQDAGNGKRAARRFMARIAQYPGDVETNIKALFDLREGDCLGGKINQEARNSVTVNRNFEDIILKELAGDNAFKVTDLAVNGHDMMKLGLEREQIGHTLKELLDLVLEDPELNNRETLMQIAGNNLVSR